VDKTTRSSLRQQLRAKRRALSANQQRVAARQALRHVCQSGLFKRHRDIAFYLANDGEIDPSGLLALACQRQRRCYLPVLAPDNSLWFARYRPGDKMKKNRFGILEPTARNQCRKPWSLGLVFLPLVGFDRQGGRLGMGGGFYDRSFKHIKRSPLTSQPELIGLAHQCQQVTSLTQESWDIPLSKIVTDEEVIRVIRDERT